MPSKPAKKPRVAKSVVKASKPPPRTLDAYLAGVTAEQRAVLEAIRRAIHALVPKAEECINYGVAAFRLDGQVLVGFGATAKHCAFYPMSGSTIAAFGKRLAGFETTKGSVKFQPERPLPLALVKALTKARMAELQG